MEIRLAKSAGFCFGVKRAVDMTYDATKDSKGVYTIGPIVHNEEVVKDLEEKGVDVLDTKTMDPDQLEQRQVVIRAHGVAKNMFDTLEECSCTILDATCPFVTKIHKTVENYALQGYDIVIIGNRVHPEVEGILGWCHGRGIAVENEKEIQEFSPKNPQKKVCVVGQTTFNHKKFNNLVEIISKKGYDIIAVDTICNATSERQTEAEELAKESDVMIVIGGKNSSNTLKLYDICLSYCPRTFFIQTVQDLDISQLLDSDKVGITAGASTPKYIIQEVLEECQKKVSNKC